MVLLHFRLTRCHYRRRRRCNDLRHLRRYPEDPQGIFYRPRNFSFWEPSALFDISQVNYFFHFANSKTCLSHKLAQIKGKNKFSTKKLT